LSGLLGMKYTRVSVRVMTGSYWLTSGRRQVIGRLPASREINRNEQKRTNGEHTIGNRNDEYGMNGKYE